MDSVKDYYGKKLTSSDDLQATAVTSCSRKTESVPEFVKAALAKVHVDIASRSYGCATTYPEALKGAKVLDLGSGCGRDCFVLSQLVGEEGRVVGLDMTDELLELSAGKIDYHTQAFGYAAPNVRFVKGFLEKMGEAGLEDGYFDVIVSNCVISLCRDKKAVLREAYRVLKPGGEMYFSDMYRDGQLPAEVMDDEVMWCEGLIGSLGYRDLHAIAAELGFSTPRLVRSDSLPVRDEAIRARLGSVRYASATFRLYKKPEGGGSRDGLATYRGGVQGCEVEVKVDIGITLKVGEATIVDGELVDVLGCSRLKPFFDIQPAQGDMKAPCLDVDPFKDILGNDKQKCSS